MMVGVARFEFLRIEYLTSSVVGRGRGIEGSVFAPKRCPLECWKRRNSSISNVPLYVVLLSGGHRLPTNSFQETFLKGYCASSTHIVSYQNVAIIS